MIKNKPYISVITRTKNRPITLHRLMENLTCQTFKDFEWVVVNDGGNRNETQSIVDKAIINNVQTKLVHNSSSLGRSKAANIGVDHAHGKYILILDDDDYTHEEYFQKAHDFFDKFPKYSAVTCWSDVIAEEIGEKNIKRHGVCERYAPDMNALSIINLHTRNIPTCGLIVKRDLFINVGGYPLDIEYSEDWSFVCRVIIETNIGLIPEVLAYISKRVNPAGFYMNTTSDIVGIQMHKAQESIWKNDRIRESLKEDDLAGLAVLFSNLNLQLQEVKASMQRIERILIRVKEVLNKIYRLCGIYYFHMLFRKIKNLIK